MKNVPFFCKTNVKSKNDGFGPMKKDKNDNKFEIKTRRKRPFIFVFIDIPSSSFGKCHSGPDAQVASVVIVTVTQKKLHKYTF